MVLETPKGMRDFLPEDKIIRDKVVSLLKEAFELYGYNPLETPALENYETLASKYAGGAEIMKEVYTVKDNGGRELGLRYDLTVPFARVIATNPEIKKPFKRYQIDKVWRDGPIKLGRYREFWQCDADVVGIKSVLAESELFCLASNIFKKLGLDVTIFINNRKLINSIMSFAGIEKEKQEEAILAVDKLKKAGIDGVRKELEEKGISDDAIARLLAVFSTEDATNEEALARMDQLLENKEGITELREVLAYTKKMKVDNIKLDISLARGLAYYTGTVLEIFLDNQSITSSVAGGGRFDKMIGNFIGSKEEIPAVGMSFGLDVITDALKINKKMESKKTVVELYVIPIKKTEECIEIIKELRDNEIKCDMDMTFKGLNKNLDFANKLKIPYVLLVGEEEIKKGKLKLRNMETGEERLLTLKEVVKEIKK